MTDKPNADDVAEQLKKLGSELAAVADDVKARSAKVAQIEEFLGNIKVRDFPDLAESPVVQEFAKMFADTSGMKPGEVRRRGTLAEVARDWTIEDFRRMPMITFIPVVSIDITINGVGPFRLTKGEECTVPDTVYDHYKEHLYRTKQAEIHKKWLTGQSDQLPDPNWLTPEGAGVAAMSRQGAAIGKRSGFLGIGWRPEAEETTGAE